MTAVTPELRVQVIADYVERELSTHAAARRAGVAQKTVLGILDQAGVPRRPRIPMVSRALTRWLEPAISAQMDALLVAIVATADDFRPRGPVGGWERGRVLVSPSSCRSLRALARLGLIEPLGPQTGRWYRVWPTPAAIRHLRAPTRAVRPAR